MREHPCITCVGLIYFWCEDFLVWMLAFPFLGLCWLIPLTGSVAADAGPPHGSMFDSHRLPFPFLSFPSFPFLPASFESSMEGGEE